MANQSQTFSLRLLCFLSVRVERMVRAWHEYQSQLNTITCCFQAVPHSFIMSCWPCWSHMAAGVREFNHRAAITLSLHYGCPNIQQNLYSLTCPDYSTGAVGMEVAGGGHQQIAALPCSLGDTTCPWACASLHHIVINMLTLQFISTHMYSYYLHTRCKSADNRQSSHITRVRNVLKAYFSEVSSAEAEK